MVDQKAYISELQITADELAYKIINERELFIRLSIIQSVCDFNIAWLYQIPYTVIRSDFVYFMAENINKFKRKISIKEALKIDTILYFNDIKTFEDLKRCLTSSK